MSIQPTLTPEQQKWECSECGETGRRGYCAPNVCLCGHTSCHAHPSYIHPKRRDSTNVVPLIPRKETG